MAKTLEQSLQDQLGALMFLLCAKDTELAQLREQLAETKAKLLPVVEPADGLR